MTGIAEIYGVFVLTKKQLCAKMVINFFELILPYIAEKFIPKAVRFIPNLAMFIPKMRRTDR